MMIVFGSGFYESRSNQIRSLFGLAPSSEYKQSFAHLFTVTGDNEAWFEKGSYHEKQDFPLLF